MRSLARNAGLDLDEKVAMTSKSQSNLKILCRYCMIFEVLSIDVYMQTVAFNGTFGF